MSSASPSMMPPSQDMDAAKAQAHAGPQYFHTLHTYQEPPTVGAALPGSQRDILLDVEETAEVLREVAAREKRATSGHDVFTDIIQINGGVVKTLWDDSIYRMRRDRLGHPPGTTTPTGEDHIELVTRTTRFKKAQLRLANPAEFIASIRRILIRSPAPLTAHRSSTTVYWEWRITTDRFPRHGTWTQYELWLVVQREVHMKPGHDFTLDARTLERDKYPEMTTFTWIHENDPEAGGQSYGGEHMKKNSNVSDCFIDKWLKRRSTGQHCKKTIKIKEMRIDGRRRRAVFFMPKEVWVKGERKEDQTMAVIAGEMMDSEEATHTNPSEGDLSLRLPVEVVIILISLVMALLPLVFTAFFGYYNGMEYYKGGQHCHLPSFSSVHPCPHATSTYTYLFTPTSSHQHLTQQKWKGRWWQVGKDSAVKFERRFELVRAG